MKPPIPKNKLLHASNRGQWHAWLKKNSKSTREIWLVYYKKHTGRPRISYNDAVEEALCVGWIDSTVRMVDANRFAQRFSVRKPRSKYSQANVERLRALAKQGKIAKDILGSLPDLSKETFTIPVGILKTIKSNKKSWKNFQRFPQPYIRIRIAFIESARKRPAEFTKRLSHFIRMTENGKQFGFGGIEKHY